MYKENGLWYRSRTCTYIYTSDENFLSYGTKEYEHIGDLYWTEEIVPVTDEIEYMEDKDLLKIEENIGALEQDTKMTFHI